LDRRYCVENTGCDLNHHTHITRVSSQIWWPYAALAAHKRGHQRLVERCIKANQLSIAAGKRFCVGCNGLRIFFAGKLSAEPEGTTVMHEVNDWRNAKLLDQVRDDMIDPGPVE